MDVDKFLNSPLALKQRTIDVPSLKPFFGKEKPQWTIRALSAAELARASMYASQGQETVKALIEVMSGDGDKAEAIRKAMGVSENEVPAEVSRRIELLTAASVDPELGPSKREVAVKLAESYGTTFWELTNAIMTLTGEGSEVGKPKRSGKTRS
ncbi:MAG: hypothetical protein Hals2KO_21640 [Halioglobus sp.]